HEDGGCCYGRRECVLQPRRQDRRHHDGLAGLLGEDPVDERLRVAGTAGRAPPGQSALEIETDGPGAESLSDCVKIEGVVWGNARAHARKRSRRRDGKIDGRRNAMAPSRTLASRAPVVSNLTRRAGWNRGGQETSSCRRIRAANLLPLSGSTVRAIPTTGASRASTAGPSAAGFSFLHTRVFSTWKKSPVRAPITKPQSCATFSPCGCARSFSSARCPGRLPRTP